MPTVAEIMRHRPSEASHWYKKSTGEPCYTVTTKNGNERNYTLADARKDGEGCPSFSEIEKLYNKPALNNWLIDQHILAAITLPRVSGETDAELIRRVKEDAKAQSKKAAERGTQIHAWVQQGFECELDNDEGMEYFRAAQKAIYATLDELSLTGDKFTCEESFAAEWEDMDTGKVCWYGGKCDLHTDMVLIDFKTTEKPVETCELYDNHFRQLGAYKDGLVQNECLDRYAVCGICFINSITPDARLIMAHPHDIDRGWGMFKGMIKSWYSEKGL